jgi:hypothetical protein
MREGVRSILERVRRYAVATIELPDRLTGSADRRIRSFTIAGRRTDASWLTFLPLLQPLSLRHSRV